MTQPSKPGQIADVGIVGGGQLARMTAERAAKLGLSVAVLDPAADCAAGGFAQIHVRAAFDDAAGLRRLVECSRVTTFDIELADATALLQLEAEGQLIWPRPTVLATLQDKLQQREFLAARELPVPRFADLPEATPEALEQFGYPLVQKARRGGYDGRGVAVINDPSQVDRMLTARSMVEEKIDIDREFAALVSRNRRGQIATYPIAEMYPDPETHVLEALTFPAQIDDDLQIAAQRLAEGAIESLGGVGIFAVELFLDKSGRLLINEISPRPHNAGHVTLDAAATCQFEQHLRAILDLPPGETRVVSPAAMVNLLGPPNIRGAVRIEQLQPVMEIPGARLHLYGKTSSWPGRKLGHLTVVDADPIHALERAREARSRLRFVASREAAA